MAIKKRKKKTQKGKITFKLRWCVATSSKIIFKCESDRLTYLFSESTSLQILTSMINSLQVGLDES